MKYNLVVVGGGLTGVAAAVSAAREGLTVLLVEKAGCLGQAAGTAVAVAIKSNKNAHTVDVKELQNKLIENGAVL